DGFEESFLAPEVLDQLGFARAGQAGDGDGARVVVTLAGKQGFGRLKDTVAGRTACRRHRGFAVLLGTRHRDTTTTLSLIVQEEKALVKKALLVGSLHGGGSLAAGTKKNPLTITLG